MASRPTLVAVTALDVSEGLMIQVPPSIKVVFSATRALDAAFAEFSVPEMHKLIKHNMDVSIPRDADVEALRKFFVETLRAYAQAGYAIVTRAYSVRYALCAGRSLVLFPEDAIKMYAKEAELKKARKPLKLETYFEALNTTELFHVGVANGVTKHGTTRPKEQLVELLAQAARAPAA